MLQMSSNVKVYSRDLGLMSTSFIVCISENPNNPSIQIVARISLRPEFEFFDSKPGQDIDLVIFHQFFFVSKCSLGMSLNHLFKGKRMQKSFSLDLQGSVRGILVKSICRNSFIPYSSEQLICFIFAVSFPAELQKTRRSITYQAAFLLYWSCINKQYRY